MALKNIILFAAAASAHFGLKYPEWRADTLTADEDSGYDQWAYPCANVPDGEGNRTDWPLSGGSLALDLHHSWTYIFVNLGLGENVTNFNITLTPGLWNSTGSGTLCIPELPVDLSDVEEGTNATLQVVTVGDGGSALYNCADVRLVNEVEEFGGEKCETEGVEYYIVGEPENPVTSDGEIPETSSQDQSGGDEDDEAGDESAAVGRAVSVAGLAVAFAAGLTL